MNNSFQNATYEIAKKKSAIRKILSLFNWIFAGITTLCIIAGAIDLSDLGFLIFIFVGLAMIFEQLSRKAMMINQDEYTANKNVQNSIVDKIPKKSIAAHAKVLNENIDPNMSIVNEGKAYVREIETAYNHIADNGIRSDLLEIKANITDIFDAASKDEAVEKQIRKVNAYYLPTMLKLLNTYIHLNTRKVQTKSAKNLKCEIAESIEKTKIAFCKLNEDLVQTASMDAQAEIDTLQNVLEIDGLLGEHSLQMPTEEKEEA